MEDENVDEDEDEVGVLSSYCATIANAVVCPPVAWPGSFQMLLLSPEHDISH